MASRFRPGWRYKVSSTSMMREWRPRAFCFLTMPSMMCSSSSFSMRRREPFCSYSMSRPSSWARVLYSSTLYRASCRCSLGSLVLGAIMVSQEPLAPLLK